MQVFQQLPVWAKALFAFLVIVAGVSGYEFLHNGSGDINALVSQNNTETSLQNINITIRNRNNSQPVANVAVQIIFDGPPVQKMTDRNGYIEIQIPKRKSAQITLTKEGFGTATETINLETDPNTTRILYLDPAKP